MEETKGKKVFCAQDTLFYNSKAMVIEYHDGIKNAWYNLFRAILTDVPKVLKSAFDFSMFQDMNDEELTYWFLSRKHQNFLMDLPIANENVKMTKEQFDHCLNILMQTDEYLYKYAPKLNLFDIIKMLYRTTGLIHKIIIFTDEYEPFAEKDIKDCFEDMVEYRFGSMEEVLKNVPNDSTFIFSNIDHILEMQRMRKLKYSSIIIPAGYDYNLNPENPEEFKFDIYDLSEKELFKLNFFNNIFSDSDEEDMEYEEDIKHGNFEKLFPSE